MNHCSAAHSVGPSAVPSNDVYFSSYEDLSVHELMLKDKPRTLAYMEYIEKNTNFFKDKVVIDVGAGSGILSLFAAKAGAKKVYAIEASNLANLCRSIVHRNNYEDVIEVIHGRVEEVNLPCDSKVDVLISEWMGFYLLHEAMLQSVIIARDRWLKTDGLMLPSAAAIYLCPVQMKEYYKENFMFWCKAYGCDLSPIAELVKQKAQAQPTVTRVEEKHLLAEPELLTHLDLMYVEAEDIEEVIGCFNFRMLKHGICHGFACWFDCEFESPSAEGSIGTLSTAPRAPPTHWQQTVMFLPDAYFINEGDCLGCKFLLKQDRTERRRYNMSLELVEEEEDEGSGEEVELDDSLKEVVLQTMNTSS